MPAVRRRAPARTAALLLGCALLACAPGPSPARLPAHPAPAPPPRILFDRLSRFGRVLVVEEGPRRVLRFGTPAGADQSAVVPGDPGALPIEYVRHALLGLAYQGHPTRVLMVGLGGGTFTTVLHRALPELVIDAVEIDPVVVEAARAWFGLREDARYRVHVADAAEWVASDHGLHDFILLDGYAGDDIPAALASEAFFGALRRRLGPAGVVAINIAEPEGSGRPAAHAFRAVFTPFYCRRTPVDDNLLIFAFQDRRRVVDTAAALRWAAAWDERRATSFSLHALVRAAGSPDCRMPP